MRRCTTQTQDINFACEALKIITKTFSITDGANGAMVFDGDAITPVAAIHRQLILWQFWRYVLLEPFSYGITSGRDYIWSTRLGNESAARAGYKSLAPDWTHERI